MNTFIKYSYVILVTAIAFCSLLFWSITTGERSSSSFSDYHELKSSGLIEKGWVPAYFPKSATQITEQHDLDTNDVSISFKYDLLEKKVLPQECVLVFSDKLIHKYICPPFSGGTSILYLNTDGSGYYSFSSEVLR